MFKQVCSPSFPQKKQTGYEAMHVGTRAGSLPCLPYHTSTLQDEWSPSSSDWRLLRVKDPAHGRKFDECAFRWRSDVSRDFRTFLNMLTKVLYLIHFDGAGQCNTGMAYKCNIWWHRVLARTRNRGKMPLLGDSRNLSVWNTLLGITTSQSRWCKHMWYHDAQKNSTHFVISYLAIKRIDRGAFLVSVETWASVVVAAMPRHHLPKCRKFMIHRGWEKC